MSAPVAAYARARCLPHRVLALGLTGVACSLVARVPVPSLSTDLDAAAYPAVLMAAAAPVLLGVLAVAPAPTRLRWLTAAPVGRARLLAMLEFVVITVVSVLAAALVGAPAAQVGVAVQNALLTESAVVLTALLLGLGPAAALVGAGAMALLLSSPSLGSLPWVLIDSIPDSADWWAAAGAGLVAAVAIAAGQ